jgi:hypothetical protein
VNTNKTQQAWLALFAALACGFGADASAVPTTVLNDGNPAPGGANTGFGGNAGAMLPTALPPLTGAPRDAMPTPVPMPAHLPPVDPALPPGGAVQQLPPPAPAAQVPEPRSAALLLGGLALMGLVSRRRRTRP